MSQSKTLKASNPNNMRYTDGRVYGKGWHSLPGMTAGGSVTFTRSSEDDSTVKLYGSFSTTMYDGNTDNHYGYPITARLFVGNESVKSWTLFNYADSERDYNTHTIIISEKEPVKFELANNTTDVSIRYFCNYRGKEGGCDTGTPSCDVFKLEAGALVYEPYKKPTVGISGDLISIYDESRSVHIDKNKSGDKNTTSVTVEVNGHPRSTNIGNSSSDYSFKPSDNSVSDGQSYTVEVTRTHSKKSKLTATDSIILYTYRTPRMESLGLSNTSFSGFGNSSLSWATNTRRWGETLGNSVGEVNFSTSLKFSTDNKWFLANDQKPTGTSKEDFVYNCTQSITKTLLDTHISDSLKNNLTQDNGYISGNIVAKRTNPESKVSRQSSAVQFTVYYKPKNAPIEINYYDYDSNGSNNRGAQITPGTQPLYIDEHPYLLIDWNFGANVDRGVINGFELVIYSDSTYRDSCRVFDISTENDTDTYGQQKINIRQDLKRGQMNYVGVKAYYTKPNGKKLYGPELKQIFILPIGKILKPKISYPVNNSNWHNKNFRILFRLPMDDDYDVLDSYIKSDTYLYRELELLINGEKYTYSNNSNIFSINKLGYMYYICVNPSIITSFANVDKYTIQVRVQKEYFMNIWSEWSDTLTLYNNPINNMDIKQFELIMATHYKYVQSSSIRLYNTYPIKPLQEDNIDQNKGDIILAKHYQAIYNTILDIQDGVNTWARYDTGKEKCKFQQNITKMSDGNKATRGELITAIKDDRPGRQGRNYKNILIDCMNQLF